MRIHKKTAKIYQFQSVFIHFILPLSTISKLMHMDMKWIIAINKTSSVQFILAGMGASDPLNNLRAAQSGLRPVS